MLTTRPTQLAAIAVQAGTTRWGELDLRVAYGLLAMLITETDPQLLAAATSIRLQAAACAAITALGPAVRLRRMPGGSGRTVAGLRLEPEQLAQLTTDPAWPAAQALADWLPLVNLRRLSYYQELHWRIWRADRRPLPCWLGPADPAWLDQVQANIRQARLTALASRSRQAGGRPVIPPWQAPAVATNAIASVEELKGRSRPSQKELI